MEILKNYQNEILNNKFFLEITFNIDINNMKETIEIASKSILPEMEMSLPEQRNVTDGRCDLVFKTKPNSKIENVELSMLVNFSKSIIKLENVIQVRFNIYEEDNSKKFVYNLTKETEEFMNFKS